MDSVDWGMGNSNGVGNGDWVGWGWMVSWTWVGHTLVLDISHISAVSSGISMVIHNLDAAIRKGHPVVSSHRCTIRSLVLAKVNTRVLILNAILKSIRLRWLSVSVSRGVDCHRAV